jgi:hypothetical protein
LLLVKLGILEGGESLDLIEDWGRQTRLFDEQPLSEYGSHPGW